MYIHLMLVISNLVGKKESRKEIESGIQSNLVTLNLDNFFPWIHQNKHLVPF
jgi:hypothetical protein